MDFVPGRFPHAALPGTLRCFCSQCPSASRILVVLLISCLTSRQRGIGGCDAVFNMPRGKAGVVCVLHSSVNMVDRKLVVQSPCGAASGHHQPEPIASTPPPSHLSSELVQWTAAQGSQGRPHYLREPLLSDPSAASGSGSAKTKIGPKK